MFPKFLHPVESPEVMKLSKVDCCSLSRLGQEKDAIGDLLLELCVGVGHAATVLAPLNVS